MSNDCLVASIQIDLTASVLETFRSDLLAALQNRQHRGVIFDFSGVEIMALSDYENIRSTISMARLMGVPAVVCGLRPGVAASLVLLGAETDDLQTARDLDMAFEVLRNRFTEDHE
jgi:rsbT antagonist protein RsbS